MRYKDLKLNEDDFFIEPTPEEEIETVDYDVELDDWENSDFSEYEVPDFDAIDYDAVQAVDAIAPVAVIGSSALESVRTHIDEIIAQLPEVPLGEFKELVSELERLTGVIREQGVRYVTESKR
ncbi:hypothetical protein FDI40_gp047 [Agrobacterium phage Atu_ph07]|uniref:Uncharacterized protein n=1 Tax=Agrobacterium phage Atu_ph07 TaxID=2024264 RepID=A0A2L0UZA1_9CAUD|nr:hypothetical protein FDI40_gp047 [Agrobacterium phage Atu_ph07]AUZ94859.1 hypothetical protein [Agrobacterium phage Atu_ph07]